MFEVTFKVPEIFKEAVTVKCKKVETSSVSTLFIRLEQFEDDVKSDLIFLSSKDMEYFKDCKSLSIPYLSVVSIKEFKTNKEMNKNNLKVLGSDDDSGNGNV